MTVRCCPLKGCLSFFEDVKEWRHHIISRHKGEKYSHVMNVISLPSIRKFKRPTSTNVYPRSFHICNTRGHKQVANFKLTCFEDFIDLKDLASKIGSLNTKSIKISDVQVLRVVSELLSSEFYKNLLRKSSLQRQKL